MTVGLFCEKAQTWGHALFQGANDLPLHAVAVLAGVLAVDRGAVVVKGSIGVTPGEKKTVVLGYKCAF